MGIWLYPFKRNGFYEAKGGILIHHTKQLEGTEYTMRNDLVEANRRTDDMCKAYGWTELTELTEAEFDKKLEGKTILDVSVFNLEMFCSFMKTNKHLILLENNNNHLNRFELKEIDGEFWLVHENGFKEEIEKIEYCHESIKIYHKDYKTKILSIYEKKDLRHFDTDSKRYRETFFNF